VCNLCTNNRALLYSALGDHAKASKSAGFASSILDSFNAVRALNIAAVQRGEQGVTVPPPLCEAVKYAFQVSTSATMSYQLIIL
jgi:hypothetical protein